MEELSDQTIAVQDKVSDEERLRLNPLVSTVKERFNRAVDARRAQENRWVDAYRNYRGIYSADMQWGDHEKSRVFIKITKTKVNAAFGQLIDVLLSQGIPLSIAPTEVPEGIAEDVHVDLKTPSSAGTSPAPDQEQPMLFGYPNDGEVIAPGTTLQDRVGAFHEKLENLRVVEGPGKTPSAVTIRPAEEAAKKMNRKIHDQLGETKAETHIRNLAFECVTFGTGILKGPFHLEKEYPQWDENGQYTPRKKLVPKLEYVSLWDYYPDPDGVCMETCDWSVQRRKMTRSDLRNLKKRPMFRVSAINELLLESPNWTYQPWEHSLNDSSEQTVYNRYEVLEYWGVISYEDLEEADIDIPPGMEEHDEYQVNVWVSGDKLLRVVFNPFTPVRQPYMRVPFELNPYNFFGIGLAENMEDSQTVMNGFIRMAIDNAALSGNMMLEVSEDNLVPGQDMKVYPGKIWRRSGGAPGQAIFGTKWPNTTNENMQVFDKFRQLADEVTGVPSFSHGQTGVTGTGRTAAGMSMLMGASQVNIKTVVKNFDDYLLRPLGEALFAFNMQFDFDASIKGDLSVKARGVAALMQQEVRSQRLLQLFQLASSNPVSLQRTDWVYLLQEISKMLDLDPDRTVAAPKMAQLNELIIRMSGQAPPQQNPGAGPPSVNDPTGGGGSNIGVGAPAMPGQEGFSGTPQPTGGQPNV